MKIYKPFIIALLAMTAAACSSSGGDPKANVVNSANAPQTANANTQPEKQTEITYPKDSYSQASPTDAFKTYIMATVNKDIPELKKSLSKSSLEFIEKSAKEQNKTIDEILAGGEVEKESRKIPEVRNEKITGDTATIEYKDETMPEFITMPLVKEDGTWKIALDKFMEDLIKKLSEEMQKN